MIGAMTVGSVEVSRGMVASERMLRHENTVAIQFPKKLSENALWKIGVFASGLAEEDAAGHHGIDSAKIWR